jgi:hypothetical protein
MRIVQPTGTRGSLKWIQKAVNENWEALNNPILEAVSAKSGIGWLSPLANDDFAEYRDDSFLERIGHADLKDELKAFWPKMGPQWDALGKSKTGDIFLVEAKAHVAEILSPATGASPASRALIEASLKDVAARLKAAPDRADWSVHFYQLANRIAHLDFLRSRNVPAWLVLVNFVGDKDMNGPTTPETWDAAYTVAFSVMGLAKRHTLSKYILHVYPQVR